MTEPLVIDEEDAAKALGLSPRTLQRWRVEGIGPKYRKLGRRIGYTEADLREFLERSRRTSTSSSPAA